MEIEQLRKEFNQVLANITEHSERFTETDHVPALEVSVMMSKINKLQEISAILKYKIQQKEEGRRASNKTEQPAIITELKSVTTEAIAEPVSEIILEEIIEVKEESIEASQQVVQEPKVEPKAAVTSTKSSVSDKFLHTPLASLKDAFSLNDRYLFANELFKKDMALFNDTVKNIDSCNSLIEAQAILTKSNAELKWDAENERVISFYTLVERRFL